MVEGFQVILERLTIYGDALLDHKRGFNGLRVFPSIAFDV